MKYGSKKVRQQLETANGSHCHSTQFRNRMQPTPRVKFTELITLYQVAIPCHSRTLERILQTFSGSKNLSPQCEYRFFLRIFRLGNVGCTFVTQNSYSLQYFPSNSWKLSFYRTVAQFQQF